VKALVGAFIDAAGVAVGVPDPEGNQGPCQAAIWPLTQSKDEAERRGGRAGCAERNVELATAGKPDSIRVFSFAGAPRKPNPASLDFFPGAFRLNPGYARRSKRSTSCSHTADRNSIEARGAAPPGLSGTPIPRRQGGRRLP
jgi:hypothetical protein